MAFDSIHTSGNQNRSWYITGMSTTFTGLSTNDIHAYIKGFLNMFWVTDHVHYWYTGFVQLVDDFFGGDADGGDEESGFFIDYDLD
jgi:hypothetical protein